jgi:DNA-binding response OmpR family regulator
MSEIEKLRADLERAIEERDFWKSEAEAATDDGVRSTLQTAFGLSRQEARLLEVLRKRPGIALKEPLFFAAWSESQTDPTMKVLDIYICKLRQKIGADAIITHWGRGYELSGAMRARINEALAQRVAA